MIVGETDVLFNIFNFVALFCPEIFYHSNLSLSRTMNEYSSIHRLFVDIHDFIVDYIKLIAHIHENSKASSKNFMMIDLTGTDFLLPASFNEYAIRANELRNNLKIHIKNLVQQRRKNISKDINEDDRLLDSQNQFNNEHKYDLKQLQKNISDENISRTVHCIRIIIDSFELFDSIQINDYFGHVTFRLVPILKHIQKQVDIFLSFIQKTCSL